jgi:autotransporter-associated beta strand protein
LSPRRFFLEACWSSSVETSIRSNDRGEIVFMARVGAEAWDSEFFGSGYALIKATLTPGLSPDNPILPTPDVILPPVPGAGPPFAIDVTPACARGFRICHVDPVVAVGYIYMLPEGAAQTFATVTIPRPLPGGDDEFELIVNDQTFALLAGTSFDLRTIDPQGVSQFTVRGISEAEELDPSDPLAFVTGLRFLGDLETTFRMYMYPILGGQDPCLFNVAAGAVVTQSGQIAGACTLRKQGGGVLTLNQPNTHTLGTSVFGGVLQVSADEQLGNAAGGLRLDGGALQALQSFSMAREFAIGSLGGEIVVDANRTLTHNGTMTGAGNLAKSGDGVLALAGDMEGYTGTLAVSSGKASIAGAFGGSAVVNAGELRANGSIAGSLFIAGGAQFTGNAQVAGAVTNNGTIVPGNSYGVQNYLNNYSAGSTARLDMEAWLLSPLVAANGITHDTLMIAGNVNGRTLINVIAGPTPNAHDLFAQLPGAITLRGKALVEVDGTVASSAFALAGPVRKHGFEYSLQHVKNFRGSTDGFFLKARPRNELLAFASLLSAARKLLAQCGSNHGFVEAVVPRFASDELTSNVDDSAHSTHNFSCDAETLSFADGSGISFGVRSGTGSSTGEISLAEAMGELQGDVQFVQAVANANYAGFELGVSAGYMSSEWTFDAMPAVAEGVIASVDISRRFDAGPFAILFSAGVDLDETECGTSCFVRGLERRGSGLEGRGEAQVAGSFFRGALTPYLSATYIEALGSQAVVLEEAIVGSNRGAGRVDVALGANAWIDDGLKLTADVRYERDVGGMASETTTAAMSVAMQW